MKNNNKNLKKYSKLVVTKRIEKYLKIAYENLSQNAINKN